MPHILFILDYFTPHKGGLETVFENIIQRLIVKGYKVSILTSHFDDKLKKIEKSDNITIYRTGNSRVQFMFFAIFAGIKIIKSNKDIQLIHTSTYGGAIPAAILGSIFHKKVILTIHEIFGKLWNFYKGRFIGFFYRLFENIIFIFPYHTYHCVSTYTLNSLRISYNIPDSKLKMIHNGVDTNFRDPSQVNQSQIQDFKQKYGLTNSFNLLYYGHTGKSKGIDYLVQSINQILESDSKIKIIFNLIDCQNKSTIKQQIIKYQKTNPDRILIFDGFEMNELRDLIACSDVVIAPSISEGFGSVHTESVAMGKILLTTNIASIPEVVRGKVKFINPRSSSEIIRGIKEILQSTVPNIPTKTFSRDENVKQLESVYQSI